MEFEDLRAELAKKAELNGFTLSGYDSVPGNKLFQIYKAVWMPCKFNGQPLELHFEIQDSKIFRLDCHWFPYGNFKNLIQADFQSKFPQHADLIEERNEFIRALSGDAQKAYPKNSRKRQLKFNALSGIEWAWNENFDWKNIADEIANIVTAVSPYIDARFGKEINEY